jgi:hypothetical protein
MFIFIDQHHYLEILAMNLIKNLFLIVLNLLLTLLI